MTDAWRKAGVFAAGIVLGGALALWAYKTWVAPADTPVAVEAAPAGPAAPAPAQEAGAAPASAPAPAPVTAVPPAASVAAAPGAGCPSEPLLARGSDGDGRFSLQAALGTSTGSEASAFLKVAADMARQGRPRDAEVAYIVACTVAAQASGSPSAPVADVQMQLAQHYATLAGQPERGEQRPQLIARAEGLLQDSARTYAAALGRNASKTQLANRRLASLHQPQETYLSGSEMATLGGAAASAAEAAGVVPGASADCANARSESEKVVCTDEEIAELDRNLDRLRAQARAVTRDPGGFAQRQEAAWARREAQCKTGDKACLRNWYAQRRKELFSEF